MYHVAFDIDLKRNSSKGLYIALEGIDGSGKTTQVERISSYFEDLGKSVIKTREPRKEGLIGDIVQKVLTGQTSMPSVALQYLFSTDRVLHHEEVILPSLQQGKVVISDRCFWSALVYGILDRTNGAYDYKNADQILIAHSILSMYHQFTVPDKTFYLKISLNTSQVRISKKHETKEIYEETEKLKKVTGGYEWLVQTFPYEITIIDGERSVEQVTEEIVKSLKLPK